MSKCVVVASGYFNPLHYGHITYLQKAKVLGTTLIVIVNNDEQVAQRQKTLGQEHLPSQLARDRVRLVRSLTCVDFAVESVDNDDSVCRTLRLLHPDIFANGGNSKATLRETRVCRELSIRMLDGLGVEVLMLQPFTQHYDWGKNRNESSVARLAGVTEELSPPVSPRLPSHSGEETHKKKFAELWMGDHPSGPSQVINSDGTPTSLRQSLQKISGVLGEKLQGKAELPFLLKVLSIAKALSIQAHPDKQLAERLHSSRPDLYKDANHKPEIAIALTEFEALCGFRPVSQLIELAEEVPELRTMIGEEALVDLQSALGDATKEAVALKVAYSHLMHMSEEVVHTNLALLAERAALGPQEAAPPTLSTIYMLVQRLYAQFGLDIGIFAVFFLNYTKMGAGECLYMAQNVPHAYLSGDIVECMACSDNVVRGGLTPKFKDIDVLCDMLDYRGSEPHVVRPIEMDGPEVLLYSDPSIEEFQVTHLQIPAGRRRKIIFSKMGPSVGVVLQGSGTITLSGESSTLAMGSVPLLAAGVEVEITAKEDLSAFVACCPPEYFTGREELVVKQRRKKLIKN